MLERLESLCWREMYILFVFPHSTSICQWFSNPTLGFPAPQGEGNRFQGLHPRRVRLQPRSDHRNRFFYFQALSGFLAKSFALLLQPGKRELLSQFSVARGKLLPHVTRSHKWLNCYQRDGSQWQKQPQAGKPITANPQGKMFLFPSTPRTPIS